GELERCHLHHHRYGFHDEHATHDRQHDFLTDNHRHHTQHRSQRQGTYIAHEHLRRVSVEPQKAQSCPTKTGDDHYQLTGARDIRNLQVAGELRMTAGVSKDAESSGHQYGRHDRQTVQAVRQIHRIGSAVDDEIGEHDIEPAHV